MNTELRKEAKNDFEKDLYKLMNNSVFGKTMENVRNYRNIKLITSEKRRKILGKLSYMDIDSFVIYIETEDFYKDIADDVEKWFDTSNYNENDKRPFTIGKNKKIPGLFTDESNGNFMKKFVALRAKIYAYLMEDDTQPANIGPQGVPRMSPSNVPRMSLKDPI